MLLRSIAAAGALLLGLGSALADTGPIVHARLDRSATTVTVEPDQTYAETIELDYTLLTTRGIRARERSTFSYYPESQKLEVLEAWVTQPDGTRIAVTEANRFTRPSAAAQSAPGFTSSLTTTVLYPQLRPGSRTHIKWRLTQEKPALLGFNLWEEPPYEWPLGLATVEVTAPEGLALHWRARGWNADETVAGGRRRVTARLTDQPGQEPERGMVSPSDFLPLFLMTTQPSLEALGALYHRQAAGKAAVTPAIQALADRIVGDRSGLDAVRAVYDWIAGNIRYVAVYLNPNDGWVPHAAAEVLQNGYGDCKDHVVLMQALLAAKGIRAEAALIDWGSRTTLLPLWVPQFNHAIVYLPDWDLYANPTNPYARLEALDRGLTGKPVVIATETGRVAQTPAARPEDNAYRLDSRMTIADDGTIVGTSRMSLSASLDSQARSAVAGASSPQDLAERLLAATPEGGFGDLDASDPKDLSRPFAVAARWQSPHGARLDGGIAYLPTPVGIDLEPVARLRQLLSPTRARRHPTIVGAASFEWSYAIALPAGFAARQLPGAVAFANAAGRYEAAYTRAGSEILVRRHLVVARDVYGADEAPALEQLLYQPIDDARSVLVLERAPS